MGFARLQAVGWTDHLIRLLFLSYGLVLLGFFYVPNAVDLYKFYSVAVLVPALLLLSRAYPLLRGNHLFLLVLLYFAYMLLTPAWGEVFQWKPYLNYLRLALYVLVFLMVTILLRRIWPQQFELMLRAVCILAALSAIVSLVLWFRSSPDPYQRIIGIGILENPNPSGYAHASFAMLNLAYASRGGAKPWLRICHGLAAAVLFYFVLMTHSRGALLALLFAVAVFFTFKRFRYLVFFIVALLSMIALVKTFFPELYAAFARHVGARPLIWESIWDHALQAPLLGLGYLTEQYMTLPGSVPLVAHNAYLATLRDGGAIGGLLLLAMLGVACRQAWRIGLESGGFACLALLILALVCMFFDTDRLLTRPRELWLVLWLPLGLIMSHPVFFARRAENEAISSSLPNMAEDPQP